MVLNTTKSCHSSRHRGCRYVIFHNALFLCKLFPRSFKRRLSSELIYFFRSFSRIHYYINFVVFNFKKSCRNYSFLPYSFSWNSES